MQSPLPYIDHASTHFDYPSVRLVKAPPCILHLPFAIAGDWHRLPLRALAPHRLALRHSHNFARQTAIVCDPLARGALLELLPKPLVSAIIVKSGVPGGVQGERSRVEGQPQGLQGVLIAAEKPPRERTDQICRL